MDDDIRMKVDELRKAAAEEDWEFVDRNKGAVCNDIDSLSLFRREDFHSKDGNIRDLAVSVFEETENVGEFGKAKSELKRLMTFDGNPYVRIRSASALYRHGDRNKAVVDFLNHALKNKDEDYRGVAEACLKDGGG